MTIKETVERGQPLTDVEVIDCHGHLGVLAGFYQADPSAERMIQEMQALGIDRTVISPHMALKYSAREGNKMMLDTVTKYPDRFWGYITINPHFPDQATEELKTYWGNPGVKGIKLHAGMHNCSARDAKYEPVYRFADENRVPILSHTWYGTSCTPRLYGDLADTYTNAVFILGHMGGTYQGMREAVETARSRQNIYLEICGSEFSETWLEFVVEHFDPDRILFGTDNPWHNPAFSFGKVAYAHVAEEVKKKILAGNFKRLVTGS